MKDYLDEISKYTIAIYETDKDDFDIDLYLTSRMKVRNANDIKPTKEISCKCSWREAQKIYEDFRDKYNVVAKFENNNLMVVCNKNNRRLLEGENNV